MVKQLTYNDILLRAVEADSMNIRKTFSILFNCDSLNHRPLVLVLREINSPVWDLERIKPSGRNRISSLYLVPS